MRLEGRAYAAGKAQGSALVLSAPISFYGGIDVTTGNIVDASHPDRGQNITGRLLVLPGGRGSSSSSSVLAEAIRLRTGPVGIIIACVDPIMVIGAIVARTLYGLPLPILACPIEGIADGDEISLTCDDHGIGSLDILVRKSADALA